MGSGATHAESSAQDTHRSLAVNESMIRHPQICDHCGGRFGMHAETSATVIADLGMPNHTFVHGQAPVCILSGALCMSSAAAHWSPAVTELVQLVRTRWRDNCFVGTKKRFQLCFETRRPRQMCD